MDGESGSGGCGIWGVVVGGSKTFGVIDPRVEENEDESGFKAVEIVIFLLTMIRLGNVISVRAEDFG